MDNLQPYGIFGLLLLILIKDWFFTVGKKHVTLEDINLINSRINALQVKMANVVTRLEVQEARRIPPEWFEQEVRDLKRIIESLDCQFRRKE